MLVLSRKIQQQVLIPGLNIRITVLSVGTNRVQLGIEAPLDIQVTRPEISCAVLGSNLRPARQAVKTPLLLSESHEGSLVFGCGAASS